jgi:Na+/H+ antiporter NhaB
MEQPDLRTWIMFFVIALGVLLWAVFLSAQGDLLWVSLVLVIVVLGVMFFKIFNQISVNASKKKAQKELTDDLRRSNESRDENFSVDDRKTRK